MKKNLQTAITTWITAAIVLVIGILCIVAENASDANQATSAYESISLVMGIVLIIVSGLGILLNALVTKRTATSETLSNGIILAAGILFVVDKSVGGGLLGLLTNYVPYVLTVLGSLVAADAILLLVMGLVKKQEIKVILVAFIVELVIAAVAIVLGVLALPTVNVISARFTILGIIMIVYAAYLILTGVFQLFGKTVDVKTVTVTANVTASPAEESAPAAEEATTETKDAE